MSQASMQQQVMISEMAEGLMAAAHLGGIDHLWFVSGSELTSFQEAAAKAKDLGLASPKIMTMVHEHVALSVAMGESMITGKPSATAAHADLGLLHYGGAIHNAFRGGYPILMTSGYPATTEPLRTVPVFWKQQRWDQGEIVRQYVKWDHKLAPYDDPFIVIARALQVALSPARGPVYLAIPAEVGPWKLDRRLDAVTPGQLSIPRLGPGPEDAIVEIAQKLLDAESPLVIVDRVGNDHGAVGVLEELAREFAIGVAASNHRHNISDEHPSAASGISAKNADVILVLEHSIPWIPALGKPRPDAWIAAVGEDAIASQIPLYEFRADLRITAAAGDFLSNLLEQLRSLRRDENRHNREARWASFERGLIERQERRRTILAADDPVITEQFAGAALNEIMDPDDILVWELAHIEHTARTKPGTLFDSGGSSLGWGIAAATGAAVVDRMRPVVCATGDGSYMFGSPDSVLWTQMRYDAPVLTVVYNNRGYRTGTAKLARDYPEGHGVKQIDTAGGTFDPPPDFAAHAEAVGCFGRKVLDKKELLNTLKEAKRAVEVDRRPAVVDVWLPAHVTGKHPFKGNGLATNGG